MKKKSTIKDDVKSFMQKPKFWIRELVLWFFNGFLLLLIAFYLDTNNTNLIIIITIIVLLFFILFYIHGTFNYNFKNPLCKTIVDGKIIDYTDDLEAGPGESVVGFLYSYIITVEYKYKNKTYKRLIKTFGDTIKIDKIFICKFFPKLVYIKFSRDNHLS